MKNYKDIDFGEVLTLLNVIVECGKHGPQFHKLAGMAGEKLKDVIGDHPEPTSVTPAAGSANVPIFPHAKEIPSNPQDERKEPMPLDDEPKPVDRRL